MDAVLLDGELERRVTRERDPRAEARELARLARDLSAAPASVPQQVAEVAMALCDADAAAVGVLELSGGGSQVRWRAGSGSFRDRLGTVSAHDASPAGEALRRNAPLLFARPGRAFPFLQDLASPVHELLVVPWHAAGGPTGVLWVATHDPTRHFDAEDARQLLRLGWFVAAHQQLSPLAEREATHAALFAMMEEGAYVVEVLLDDVGAPRDFVVLRADGAHQRITGLADVVGRRFSEFVTAVRPESLAWLATALERSEPVRIERRARTNDRWFEATASRLGGEGSRTLGIVFADITERKRAELALRHSEARHAYLVRLTDTLRPLADAEEIQSAAARLLGEQLGVQRVLYAEIVDGRIIEVRRDWSSGLPSVVGRHPVEAFGASLRDLVRGGDDVAVADVRSDPRLDDAARAAFLHLGAIALADVPLQKDGRWVACLGAHATAPREWTQDELLLIRETAERIWLAVARARAEAALRESELRYRGLFQSIDEGFCIVEVLFDDDGRPVDYRFLEVNGVFEAQSGLRDAVGRRARELVPDLDQFWYDTYGAVARTGEPQRFVNHAPAMGRWFDVYAFRVGAPEEHRVALLFKDISEAKQREAAQAFLETSTEAIAQLGSAEEIMLAAGAQLGAFLGVPIAYTTDIDEARDLATMQHAWTAPAAPRIPGSARLSDFVAGEFLRAMRAGEPVVVPDALQDLRCDPGAFRGVGIGAFIAVPYHDEGRWTHVLSVADVCARTWRDDEVALVREFAARLFPRIERARSDAALRESEERLRATVDSITDYAIFTVDLGGRVASWSDGALRTTGWAAEEILGRPVDLLYLPEDRAKVPEEMRRASTTGRSEDESWRLRKDGTRYWCNEVMTPLRAADGRVIGFAKVSRDLTERKRMEDALRTAREAAEEASRAKDEFMAMLGHELRNPLAPIVTALELMRLRGAKTPEQDILDRQVGHLTHLVDDLMDVSRIARGKIELQRRTLDLGEVVTRALEQAAPLLEQRRNRVDVRLPPEGLVVDADRNRLAQVLANLLTNASKYSGAGSRIVLAAERVDRTVRLTVTDEGVGIPPGMLSAVFDPFVQQGQDIARTRGGLGLGLAIVRSLVVAHGGRVWAESPGPGRGSTFTVELPVGRSHTREVEEAALRQAEPSLPGMRRVLIVDDNADAALTLRVVLEHLGYVTEVASDGESAVARASVFDPAIVLLDIGLPDIDGYEVVRRLRRMWQGRRNARVLAVTGYGQPADRERAREAGFDHHLVKPINVQQLRILLEESP